MSMFSPKLTPKDVVDRMVRGGVAACKANLSQFGDVPDIQEHNERLLTLLAVDRLTWELALSRVDGLAIERIREAVGEHYGDLLVKELGGRMKAPRKASKEEKQLLASSLARQVSGRTASLGKEWNAHRHDRPGPEYWACKRAVQLMGLDETNPANVTRLSAKVRPTLVSNTRYIKDVARRVKTI